MRVCCLNNYPLAKMVRLADAHEMPRQHLWGVDALAAHGEVDLAPFHEPAQRARLDRASRRLGHRLGQLDQEAYALRRGRFDALYSADQYSLRGVALLPRPLRRGARVVSVVHHPDTPVAPVSLALRRHTALLALGERIREDAVRAHGLDGARVHVAPWGPDLGFPGYESTGEEHGVVSTGKSNRDLVGLLRALADSGAHGVVYDLDGVVAAAPEGVRLVRPGGPGADPDAPGAYLYATVLAHLRGAAVVAIPLEDPHRLSGLTEINDALALGKPIVITRSPYTPVDVAAVGCGIEVEPGDAAGWSAAIGRLQDDPGLRAEMGRRGRAFAEEHFNYRRFCAAVTGVVLGGEAA